MELDLDQKLERLEEIGHLNRDTDLLEYVAIGIEHLDADLNDRVLQPGMLVAHLMRDALQDLYFGLLGSARQPIYFGGDLHANPFELDPSIRDVEDCVAITRQKVDEFGALFQEAYDSIHLENRPGKYIHQPNLVPQGHLVVPMPQGYIVYRFHFDDSQECGGKHMVTYAVSRVPERRFQRAIDKHVDPTLLGSVVVARTSRTGDRRFPIETALNVATAQYEKDAKFCYCPDPGFTIAFDLNWEHVNPPKGA